MMSYREKLEQYKKHQLTDEENRKVEEDIEKAEAIGDYLAEQLTEDMSLGFFDKDSEQQARFNAQTDADSAKEFEAYVRKSIHRSFRKMGLAVGSVILAVVLFVQFGMSPVMSAFYYNPARTTEVKEDNGGVSYVTTYSQIGIDFHVYAELTLPCKGSDYVQAFSTGYGNYQILLTPSIGYGAKRRTMTAGQIRKGKLELYDPDYFRSTPMNYFAGWGLDQNQDFVSQMKDNVIEEEDGRTIYNRWFYGTLEDGQDAVDDLNDDGTMYQAYVSFNCPKTFDEVNEIITSMKEQDILPSQIWVAVYGDEDGTEMVGYDYDDQQGNIPVALNETYPELTLFEKEGYDDADYEKADLKRQDEAAILQHLVSMLKYMQNQHKFTSMMADYTGRDTENWQTVADYIEEHGISSYGFVCITTKADMQKMLKMDAVIGIVPETWE